MGRSIFELTISVLLEGIRGSYEGPSVVSETDEAERELSIRLY